MQITVIDTEPVKLNSPHRNEHADNYRYLAFSDKYLGLPGAYAKSEEEAVNKLMTMIANEKERLIRCKINQ